MYGTVKTYEKIAETGAEKGVMQTGALFVSGFLAGAYIAAGFLLSVIAASSFSENYSLFRIMLGAFFPLGLMAVLFAGAELWTGNVLFMSAALMNNRSSLFSVIKNWSGSYAGNFAGAVSVAAAVTLGTGLLNRPVLRETVLNGTETKISGDFFTLFMLGLLCNWLVDLAIWMFNRASGTMGKAFLAWIPIFAFVAMGFEHSIANMWIIPSALFIPESGINWLDFMHNIIPVTLGNAAGGIFLVSIPYAYIAGKKNEIFKSSVANIIAVIMTFFLLFALPLIWVNYITGNIWVFIVVFILNGLTVSYAAGSIYGKRSMGNGKS